MRNYRNDERDARILDLYGSGWLLKDIAVAVGMQPHSVGQALRRLGIDRPAKPQKKIVDYDDATIIEMWDHGLSASAISERVGIGGPRVREIIRASGRKLDFRARYDSAGGSIAAGGALHRVSRRT